ncbi:MAG: glycosyltransferase family 2 protein [Actinomycetota bacterium]|nr:glycosyltransferase family 2 protein [Actinomycetota bacterium]
MAQADRIRISVGVLAHNEERLIGRVVAAYLAQETQLAQITEVIVVSCGSTDATDSVVKQAAVAEPRIQLVSRPQREGKVGAIRVLAELADGEILLIGGGDVIPESTAVEHLVAPFARDPRCGMTGARVCPAPADGRIAVRLSRVLWQMHHEMATKAPKLGEVIAVRAVHVHRELPSNVHCDEVLLEALVSRDQARLRYVPSARVINFPPITVGELFQQRRRIACQHLAARRCLRYRPSSSRIGLLCAVLRDSILSRPRDLPVIVALSAIEAAARAMGCIDYAKGERYRTWSPANRPDMAVSTVAEPRSAC